ncbi:Cupin [Emericellopsis cladophorae]|uniref:Cupin n=1 Tax=Emericellopsis cladophorae TaxID=2686198 RepID=A0A9P9XZ94_9HYPO|nr:Cupin [Emericellopsis cladophorae]KAI6780626.1 Cupin [Emericellopsis cladophorae]
MLPKSSASITPLRALTTSRHQIPAHGFIPNTSISHHPLLIYHGAFQQPVNPSSVEQHLTAFGVVKPHWRYSMYTKTHFHSTAHEVLVVTDGRARLNFGGEENPGRVELTVDPGDVIVIPAGVSHRLLHDESGAFAMVGSYPVNSRQWDMCYGGPDDEDKVNGIGGLSWFERDPVYGDDGPVLHGD